MNKQTIIMALLLALCLPVWAQKQYKVAEPSGKLYLNLNGARIEGYTGKEIIFSNQGVPEEEDERARGLQALSSSGVIDNTGLGISVVKRGNDIEVNPVGNSSQGGVLFIRVPNTVDIVFNSNQAVFADTLLIKGMKGEIEVSSSYNDVVLEDNRGPMNIKSVYKNVEATFTNDIKGPISIISVYGHVDVAMSPSAKASLTMSTGYGKLYAARDFNVAITPDAAEEETEETDVTSAEGINAIVAESLSAARDSLPKGILSKRRAPVTGASFANVFGGIGENIEGTVNGGGIDLILKSTYKNVYLRTD